MKSGIKYLIAIVCQVLLAAAASAQIFTGGVEGEIISSSVKISDIKNQTVNVVKGKDIMGYEAGMFLRFGCGPCPLYFKPKFLIAYQKGNVDVSTAEHTESVSFSVARLDIPVLVGLKLLGPLSVEAGPVYNRILSATKDFNGNSIDVKPGGLGYRVGANAQLGPIGLNVAYQGVKNSSTSSSTFSSFETPDELIFGASLSFGK